MKIKTIKNPQSVSDDLLNLVSGKAEVFRDQHGEPYLVYTDGRKNNVIYFNNSEKAFSFLRKLYFDVYNKTIKQSDIKTTCEMLCSFAESCYEEIPVYTRVFRQGNTLYYDLANKEGNVVFVSLTGCCIGSEKTTPPCFFYRDASLLPQVRPEFEGTEYGILDLVEHFFNVDENQKILFAVSLCAGFISDLNRPIWLIEGEKGSGKSTALRYMSKIFNPVKKDLLVLPKDTQNLVTVLSNNSFCAFDNVGTIKDDTSNVLCQAVTGGSLSKRKLYSDNNEVCINIKRLVALNGINMGISQSDLLDRSIWIHLNRIQSNNRRTEMDLDENFTRMLPSALGNIFQILGKAFEIYYKTILDDYPRMADFCRYGYAIAEAMQEGLGPRFIDEYNHNQYIATKSSIGDNPLLECIEFLYNSEGYWVGSMSDLLIKLREILSQIYIDKSLPYGFPKTANALSRKLNTHKYDLKSIGIELEIGRNTERYVQIGKKTENIDDIVDNDENNEF